MLRAQWHGWDHLWVLLSLVYRMVRCLVGLLAVLIRSDLSKDAELLPAPDRTAVRLWVPEPHAADAAARRTDSAFPRYVASHGYDARPAVRPDGGRP